MARRLRAKESNFYRVYIQKPAKSRTVQKIHRLLAFPILLVAIIGIVFATFGILNLRTQQMIADLQAYTEHQDHLALVQESKKIAEEKTSYMESHTQLLNLRDALDSYPLFDLETLLAIASCTNGLNVTIAEMRYDSELGILSIEGRSPFVVDAPVFAQNLQSTDLFLSMDYTGYGADSDGTYRFHIECLRKGVDSQ